MSRRFFLFLWDCSSWFVAIILAVVLRYEFDFSKVNQLSLVVVILSCWTLQGFAGSVLFNTYRGRYLVGSFDEVRLLAQTTLVTTVGLVVVIFAMGSPRGVAISIPVIGFANALIIMLGARYFYRWKRTKRYVANGAKRVLVIGAGFETEAFLRSIQLEDNPAINPIAILDDNPYKKNMRIGSLPVVGVVEDLEAVIPKFEVDQVLIVDPEISAMSVKEISEKCSEYGVPTYIMPRISEISQDPNGDVLGRPLEVSDLLGRRELNLDEESIRSVIRDKTVLVTGAGGSIGAELCRQIKRLKPGTLLMLDRDESSLHALQLSLVGNGLLTDANIILADIRDATRINEIFEKFSPDIVFHAAALKHLPLLESAPDEAWKTNVVGTKNVLAASKDFDVSIFVNISTDKAADPTSILGLTKRLTERLVCGVGLESSFKYVSVRFGNVLGSRGSMLDAFTYQISQGGPVTVTDPSVSRYFMTIPEASQLVLQAAVLGEQGEVLVLDMGEPVKILDVAEFLIARSGKEIAIEFTGLREGEKLHEVLSGIDENSEIRKHSLISHLRVEPIVNIDEAKFIFENRIY